MEHVVDEAALMMSIRYAAPTDPAQQDGAARGSYVIASGA